SEVSECPLWVKSGHRGTSNQCPLYPNSGHWNSVTKCPLCAKSGHSSRVLSPRHHACFVVRVRDADRAAKIIQNALGIESDDVVNYTFPKNWPADRERRAAIIVAADRDAVSGLTCATKCRTPKKRLTN